MTTHGQLDIALDGYEKFMVDQSAPEISGYAKDIATIIAEQEATKPLIGKPTLRYGQCHTMSCVMLQLGSVLAVKYRNKLVPFAHAFLGAIVDENEAKRFLALGSQDVGALIKEGMTYGDFITAEHMRRMNSQRDPDEYHMQMRMKKLDVHTSKSMFLQFAQYGVVLGAAFPQDARKIFEQTFAPSDQKDWDLAREAGLDLPEKQPIVVWEEEEKSQSADLLAYCQEFAPSLYEALR